MRDSANQVAQAFGLGTVRNSEPVRGGLSNDMWRMTTNQGQFAVKAMRVNADNPDFEANVEAAFLIEQAAFANAVPCPEPIPTPDGRCLARINDRWIRVHQWVNGSPPSPGTRSDDAAALLATIQTSAATTLAPLDDEPWDADGWASLADHPDLPADLAEALRSAAPTLANLELATAAPGQIDTHVPSHGDLDPKNTLVVDGTLLAVDWDAAGPRSQAREAVSVALDWTTDVDRFRSAIETYTRASGVSIPAEPWVFGGWVSALGGWLVYQATHCANTPEGRHEITQATQRLTTLDADLPAYIRSLP